jgi:hypothetical protein
VTEEGRADAGAAVAWEALQQGATGKPCSSANSQCVAAGQPPLLDIV